MKQEDIYKVLTSTGVPFAYRAWPEEVGPPSIPFGVYLQEGTNPFGADGTVYATATDYRVELYTEKKDPATEEKLEAALTGAGIFFRKSETFIETERLFEIIYEIEV